MKKGKLDFFKFYVQELQHIRQMGREFAAENPKIAARLDPDKFAKELCQDPYVERLLEGFAFLTARVQLKLHAEFPTFCQHLLEFVYPHYLAPTPAMLVVKFELDEKNLPPAAGFPIKRHTLLKANIAQDQQGHCKFRTAQQISLLPLQLSSAAYLPNVPEDIRQAAEQQSNCELPELKAVIRLNLNTCGEHPPLLNTLSMDKLPIYLHGEGELPGILYEQLLADAVALLLKAGDQPVYKLIPHPPQRFGFSDEQALLPYGPRSFQGYRLLQEYFAFPQRFNFVELVEMGEALQHVAGTQLEIFILLKRAQPQLIKNLDQSLFALFCTPAINLFPQRAEPIHLTHKTPEYRVVAHKTGMTDLEIYSLETVTGYSSARGSEQVFQPFYKINSDLRSTKENAYYTQQRRATVLSAKEQKQGKSTDYAGSEIYISLVDAKQPPYDVSLLKELGLELLCTNRDFTHTNRNNHITHFTLDIETKTKEVRCLTAPSTPKPAIAVDDRAWRLISHLSLNYLSIVNSEADGAAALRELLGLYCDSEDDVAHQQIAGIRSVSAKNVVRRIPAEEAILFGRGVEITVQLDESAFSGASAFLFGAVLEQFFARYASLNTFTETLITTHKREIMRWPSRIGQRHTL